MTMVRLRNGGLLRVICPSCARYAYRVGSYWLCTALDCDLLVVAAEVPLTKGRTTLVDPDDYEVLSRHKWTLAEGRRGTYAVRHEGTRHLGTHRRIWMHRQLLEAPAGLQVDHVNGDGLDNRRNNLRLATHAQNLVNQKPRVQKRTKSSRFKGVHWSQRLGRWMVQIGSRYIGLYDVEEDAARAYDAAAVEMFGEFAWTNGAHGLLGGVPA